MAAGIDRVVANGGSDIGLLLQRGRARIEYPSDMGYSGIKKPAMRPVFCFGYSILLFVIPKLTI